MRQVFVFEKVAVIVGPWHEPAEPPERGRGSRSGCWPTSRSVDRSSRPSALSSIRRSSADLF